MNACHSVTRNDQKAMYTFTDHTSNDQYIKYNVTDHTANDQYIKYNVTEHKRNDQFFKSNVTMYLDRKQQGEYLGKLHKMLIPST